MNPTPLYESDIPGFPVHRGKVRDVYDLGDRLLVVATDRLSAFDVIFPDPIPMKGALLTQISLWWFEQTKDLVPNHILTTNFDEYPAQLQPYRDQLEGRSMIVKKCKPLMGEFIVRGYLDGSAWKSYEKERKVCGINLLEGLQRRSPFGAPIFTPSTKAEEGHDINVDFERFCQDVDRPFAEKARDYSIALYTFAHNKLFNQGLILSDTKFEFGIDASGELILIDEVLTPDSSRFWLKETYTPDSEKPISLDKQYVRDFAEGCDWDKTPPAPKLPADVIEQTTERYRRAVRMVTGKESL